MITIRDLRKRIKKRDNVLFLLIHNIYKSIYGFHIPIVGPLKTFIFAIYKLAVFGNEIVSIIYKIVIVEPVFRSICLKVGDNLKIEKIPYVRGSGKIIISSNVYISGKIGITFGNQLKEKPVLSIGHDSFIAHGSQFRIASNVSIGSYCYLAGNCFVYDVDGHPVDSEKRRENVSVGEESISPVIIEDDVWIGVNVIILKGVRIGSRSIIGAGTIVSKDIPPDSIAVGNPVRIIRSLVNSNK